MSQLSCLSPGIWKLGAEPLDWVSVHLDAKPTRLDYGTTKFGYLDTHAQEEHHGGQVVQDVPPRSLHALEGAANVEYAFAPDGIVIVGLCHCQGRGLARPGAVHVVASCAGTAVSALEQIKEGARLSRDSRHDTLPYS